MAKGVSGDCVCALGMGGENIGSEEYLTVGKVPGTGSIEISLVVAGMGSLTVPAVSSKTGSTLVCKFTSDVGPEVI